MLSRDVVQVGAKSAAARLVGSETAEVGFLTEDNKSLRVMLPQEALFILARRIAWPIPSVQIDHAPAASFAETAQQRAAEA